MSNDPIEALLEKLEKGDNTAKQDAVKEIFNEILRRAKDDIILLRGFHIMDIELIKKVGESLAIIGRSYFHVIDHRLSIQKWGSKWDTFITSAFSLYQKEYSSLLNESKTIFMFLGNNSQSQSRQGNTTLALKSDEERYKETSAILTKIDQEFADKYFKFYMQLQKHVSDLSSSTNP